MAEPVIIEVAVNGGRSRAEHAAIPCTPAEVADDARRCAAAGASVLHFHAQDADGNWTAESQWYAKAIRLVRAATSGMLISLTSIRPAGVPVDAVLDSLAALARSPETVPDLISVNLGHGIAWERAGGTRRTIHFPNDYADIWRTLQACRDLNITPELGVMDLGFISNAVALRVDGAIPGYPWFLVELDSPAYGAGRQTASATVADYEVLSSRVREHFPRARWAAHGAGLGTYDILLRALDDGDHVRVGFEDSLVLPNGRPAPSNADLVAWAATSAAERGRRPATPAEARAIIRGSGMT